MDLNLKNKVAIVTGGAQGIGKEISTLFANEGAKVVIVDVNQEVLANTCAEFEKKGLTVFGQKCDVSKENEVARVFENSNRKFGSVDIVVNNAGLGGWAAPIQDATVEAWNKVFDVNMLGVFLFSKYAFRYMIPQGEGVVLSIGSFAGKMGTLFGDNIAYSTSKAGVIGFTKALSIEGCRHNIRTVCVCPGVVNTEILKFHSEKKRALLNNKVPLGHMAEPIEIARVVTFLCSEMASHITGEVVDVNGGLFTD
jgi:3-oxoacyl-[acyl-carrier protein] reductase